MAQDVKRKKLSDELALYVIALVVLLILAIVIISYHIGVDSTPASSRISYETTSARGIPFETWRIKNLPVRDPLLYRTLSGNDVKVRVLKEWDAKLIVDTPNVRRYEISTEQPNYMIKNLYYYDEIKLEKLVEEPQDFKDWVNSCIMELDADNSEVELKQFFNLPHYMFAVVVDHTKRYAHFYIGAVTHNYAYHIAYKEGEGSTEIITVIGDILTQLTGVKEEHAAQALMIDPLTDYFYDYLDAPDISPFQWYQITSPGKYFISFHGKDAIGTIRLISEEYGDYSEIYYPITGSVYNYTVMANQGDKFIFYGHSTDIQIESQYLSGPEEQIMEIEPISVYGFPADRSPDYVYKTIQDDQNKIADYRISMNGIIAGNDSVYENVVSSNEVLENSQESVSSDDFFGDENTILE